MNTPEPCVTCKHLYYDAMHKEDPNDLVECTLEHQLGDLKCVDYCHYLEKCPGCGKKGDLDDNGLCPICNGAEDYPSNER